MGDVHFQMQGTLGSGPSSQPQEIAAGPPMGQSICALAGQMGHEAADIVWST